MITKVSFCDYEGSMSKIYRFTDSHVTELKINQYFEEWIIDCAQSPIMKHWDVLRNKRMIREAAAYNNGILSINNFNKFQMHVLIDYMQEQNIKINFSLKYLNINDLQDIPFENYDIIDSCIDELDLNVSKTFDQWLKEKGLGEALEDEVNVINLDMTR